MCASCCSPSPCMQAWSCTLCTFSFPLLLHLLWSQIFSSSLFQRQFQYLFFIQGDREQHRDWVFKTNESLSNCFHPPWLHKLAVIIPRSLETNVFRMALRPFIGITFTVTLQLFLTDVCRKCYSLVMQHVFSRLQ